MGDNSSEQQVQRYSTEHIRAVHFALLLSSAALAAASTSGSSSTSAAALREAREVLAVSQGWGPTFLMDRIREQTGAAQAISFQVELPSEVLSVTLPSPVAYLRTNSTGQFEQAAMGSLSRPGTLRAFGDLWDRLLDLHAAVPNDASLRTVRMRAERQTYRRSEFVDFFPKTLQQVEPLASQKPFSLCEASLLYSKESVLRFETGSCHRDAIERPRAWTPFIVSSGPIDHRVAKLNGQSWIVSQFSLTWLPGKVSQSIPELSKAAQDLLDVPLESLVAHLAFDDGRATRSVQVAGVTIPASHLFTWGALILIVMEFYLLLHLQAFRRAHGQLVGDSASWIGSYSGRVAASASYLSFIFPTGAVVMAGWAAAETWAWLLGFWISTAAIGLLCVRELQSIRPDSKTTTSRRL